MPINGSIKKIAIVGPTAIGKTAFSISLAEHIGAEIISVDSMQVYRYMDIGTAKPSREERQRVSHHLIDVAFPDENYHTGRFVNDSRVAIQEIAGRGKIPLLVGGTGLYLKGLLEGIFELPEISPAIRMEIDRRCVEHGPKAMHQRLALVDPDMAAKIHPNDSQRIKRGLEIYEETGKTWSEHIQRQKNQKMSNCLILGLTTADRTVLYERINRRSCLMMEEGFVEEVQNLLNMGYSASLKTMQSIGYRHIIDFLNNKRNMHDTVLQLARDTRRYAKRQYTWFNRVPGLQWFESTAHEQMADRAMAFLDSSL